MEQPGYYRRYIILEELDPGFGMQQPPEGFARFEGNKQGITVSLQIKHLREGTAPYTVILIYSRNKELRVIRAGSLEIVSRSGYLKRNLDYAALKEMGLQPENMQYVLIAAEHRERIFIPLVGICSKTIPWDEAVRQKLLRKEKSPVEQTAKNIILPEGKALPDREKLEKTPETRVDDIALEQKLREAFENIEPFSNPRKDYSWYRVNDLARLSNLLYACNLRIPLFANPRILVGLFKYRHLLAGFYRSDHQDMNYFVLGIPAREGEGKPFENICRWVAGQNKEFGDMNGYWLVYINLSNGEFVK